MISSILSVCVGNICRSPMAEALLRSQLHNISIESAGIGALVGHPADPMAIALLAERNLDISKHRARQINLDMCQRFEIILVMEASHQKYIYENYPFARGKVFLLASHTSSDIADPYRRPKKAFEDALDQIADGVQTWCSRIARL